MKRFALALPAEQAPFSRDAGGYGRVNRESRAWVNRPAIAEIAAKAVIVALFSSMAFRLGKDWLVTGHLTGMLLLASESLVVALTLIRRPAGTVDRTWTARLLTGFSTFGPNLVTPLAAGALAPELLTVAISGAGLLIVVLGKLSIGRSFGLAPANRGIVSTGLYTFVRHPIYLGYLITHTGFALANPAGWNLGVLAVADLALMLRAVREEQTLAADAAYGAYMQRVRWRIVPGVF
jgi:protein-S-isoprenylcysteine O-methyltransferase Ste14